MTTFGKWDYQSASIQIFDYHTAFQKQKDREPPGATATSRSSDRKVLRGFKRVTKKETKQEITKEKPSSQPVHEGVTFSSASLFAAPSASRDVPQRSVC